MNFSNLKILAFGAALSSRYFKQNICNNQTKNQDYQGTSALDCSLLRGTEKYNRALET